MDLEKEKMSEVQVGLDHLCILNFTDRRKENKEIEQID